MNHVCQIATAGSTALALRSPRTGVAKMSLGRTALAALVAGLLVVSPIAVNAVSPSPSAAASAVPPASVAVTVRTRADEPCPNEPGCWVGVAITPAGSDTPVLEGTLDPESETPDHGASLTMTAVPGTYVIKVTSLAVREAAPLASPDGLAIVATGSCGATLELVPEHPMVEIVAAMAWDQPACGIVIEPRASADAVRPVLADPIRPTGPPPRFRPRGAPTATATGNGIKLELWVKDATLERGQWLLAHLRVTNVSRKAIKHQGLFDDLRCPPLQTTADTSALFDPGQSWTGVAATYKERFIRDGFLLRASLEIPKRDRGPSCGEIGRGDSLEPGAVVEVPLAGIPAYSLRDQPLPPGIIHIAVTFEGRRYQGPGLVTVSTDVTLAGEPVDYPSPGQLVDAALATPGFIETLERAPDPRGWANTHISWWQRPPYPGQPRVDAAHDAPDGILEIMQFLGSDIASPFVVGAVVDPWTGESFGAYGW